MSKKTFIIGEIAGHIGKIERMDEVKRKIFIIQLLRNIGKPLGNTFDGSANHIADLLESNCVSTDVEIADIQTEILEIIKTGRINDMI